MKLKKLLVLLTTVCMFGTLVGCGNKDNIDTNIHTNQIIENNITSTEKIDEVSSNEIIEENINIDKDIDIEEDVEIIVDYNDIAEKTFKQIENFFEALKVGDMKTILAMSNENQETYETLVKMNEYDYTPKFFQLLFGNMKYYINEENISDLARDLEKAYENNDELIHLNIAYSKPVSYMTNNAYLMSFEEGTTIPKKYLNNNDEAFECIEKMMSFMPMCLGSDFWITTPDKDGNIKICIDYVLEDLGLQDLRALDSNYPMYYVQNKILASYDVTIGDNQKPFKDDNKEFEMFGKYLELKDFNSYADYLYEFTGTDYKTQYEETYGKYEDLNENQKLFVDDFITNKFYCDLFTYYLNDDCKEGMLVLISPVLNDSEGRSISLTENYIKDNIVKINIEYGNADNYEVFLWYYYRVIEYAKNNIE